MQNIRNSRWFDRALERSPDYVSFGLVILCGFLLARLTWALFPADPRLPAADSSLPADQPASIMQDLGEKIANYHLFGRYEPNKAEPAQAAPVRNTQLALKLQGVFSAGKQGQAVIEEGGQQKAYAIGQTIGNSGAVLENVYATYVELRYNGNLEKLELPKPELSGGAGAGPADGGFIDAPPDNYQPEIPFMDGSMNAPVMGAEGIPAEILPDNETAMGVPPPASGEAPSGGDADLAKFRQDVMNNNMRLLEVASPQPYEVNGKFVGFKLQPGSKVDIFNKIGFQPGDIVTAVNGTVMDSPAAGMQALQSASTASSITLSITRGGQQISLPVSF